MRAGWDASRAADEIIPSEVERGNIGKLERIRGVAYVEESREIKL